MANSIGDDSEWRPLQEAVLDRHVANLQRRNRRPSTIYQRRRALARLEQWIAPTLLLEVSTRQLEEFLGRPLTPGARATETTHLQQFYKWALRTGEIDEDPTEPLGRPKVPRCLPRPISDQNLRRALANAPERIRPWLHLAAYAGLRAGEIAQLRAEAVALDAVPPVIVIEESKGGGMSSVPMHPHLVEVLRRADLPTSGYLFRRGDGQPGPNAPWIVSQIANRYLHSIGMEDTLHSLRHWFGTNTYRSSGRDLRITQELMRHMSPITTAQYTYVDPAEAVAAVQGLPTLDDEPGETTHDR